MPDPKEVHVKVILDPPGSSPATDPPFHFETTDLPMGPNNRLIFRNCGHPGFLIHYDLDDTNNPGYRFPEPSLFPPNPPNQHLREALYCAVGSSCPTTQSTWGQFLAEEVAPGGNTLIVHNKNQSVVDFYYTLRVTNDGGASYGRLDPGGGNENGPPSRFDSAFTIAVITCGIVGGAAGSILTLGAQALLQG